MSGDFNPEQKRYLEGFVAGLQIAKAARGGGGPTGGGSGEPSGPDAPHLRAQDRVVKAGGKLSEQEKLKRELHPFDGYERLKAQAANNEYPKPADNFRWRFFGLFYVAPNQNSYMCRLRMPNGILTHWQFAGVADLAERYGGGYAHVTTRANLQVREVEARNAVAMVEAIQDLGLCSRGSGADNIRNVTGSPTAGIDPQELIDTRPYAREWHFHILNERALFGLPRKFNVGFDGAGIIPVLEDTNDIGFQAVEVKDGFGVEPGVWFRLMIGGITGHKDFARETGVVVKPADATKVADAIVRVFIDHGDRTDRNKARLKYVIDRMGLEKVLSLVEEKLGRKLDRVAAEAALASEASGQRGNSKIARAPDTRPEPGSSARATALASEASGQRGNSSEVRAHSASKDARERADDTRPEPGSSARATALASEASGQRGNSSEVRAHSASKDARERADDTRPEPGSSARALAPRPPFDRTAHIGVHAQKQPDRNWIGVVLPVGKMTVDQMRGLAAVAHELGDGDIRLTVWQNLIISGVPSDQVAAAQARIDALGLSTSTNSIRAGLVACTGNVGCKFAASDTKGDAEAIARWCESRVALDGPVNIHLTGCHHSCAQHYIGDIGLIACKVQTSEEGDTVEGYHIHGGGGFGPDAAIAPEIYHDIKAADAPRTIERMLKTYLAHRSSPQESFQAFTRRHEVDALRALIDSEVAP